MGLVEAGLAGGWLVVSCLATLGTALYLRGLAAKAETDPGPFPPLLVLLPIRAGNAGEAEEVRDCLAALAEQDYPGPWRVILILEDERDLATPLARGMDPARFSLILAGAAEGRSQKVHNLLAGLACRDRDEPVVVTLDADTRPQPSWLSELTRPLRLGLAEVASGYRWLLPIGLPARIVALADRGPATLARPRSWNLLWGGSTAITAEALDRVDIRRLWQNAVSDDLPLTRAVKAEGLLPWTPRRVLVPSPVRHSWSSLFAFARRQLMLLRAHAPFAWLSLGTALLLPAIAVLSLILVAAQGSAAAMACLLVGLGLQQLRATMRLAVARRVLAPKDAAAVTRKLPLDRLLLPLVHLLHLGIFLTSAFGRRLRWRGRLYEIPASRPKAVRRQPTG